jgi:predicted PurR-regulated permease PerM
VKLKAVLHRTALDRNSAVRRLTTAADEIQQAAVPTVGDKAVVAAAVQSPIKLRELMWTGTAGLVSGLAEAFVVLALSYFLLISGHDFKRKLVRISGRSLRQKIVTVEILEEIDTQIQRYLLLQVGSSALVGVLIGLAFAGIGLENALFWGVAAGVLHLIPYVGPALVLAGATVFAYLQFPDIDHVLYVLASGAGIVWIVGMVMVPVLTQKMRSLNAVATFVSLILWDWLWGVPGLLLGVPIMMALMAVCERIESMHSIAELLNSEPSKAPVAPVVPVVIAPTVMPTEGEIASRPQELRP